MASATEQRCVLRGSASVVLRIGDLLHPCDILSVQRAGDSQVCQGIAGRGAMSVLDAGRAPDHITRTDDLHGFAPFLRQSHAGRHHQPLTCRMRMPGTFALRPASAGSDNQRLPQRMGVPCRARARLESDRGA